MTLWRNDQRLLSFRRVWLAGGLAAPLLAGFAGAAFAGVGLGSIGALVGGSAGTAAMIAGITGGGGYIAGSKMAHRVGTDHSPPLPSPPPSLGSLLIRLQAAFAVIEGARPSQCNGFSLACEAG